MDRTYSFDEDFVKGFADYPAFKAWSNGRHPDDVLMATWVAITGKSIEVAQVVKEESDGE